MRIVGGLATCYANWKVMLIIIDNGLEFEFRRVSNCKSVLFVGSELPPRLPNVQQQLPLVLQGFDPWYTGKHLRNGTGYKNNSLLSFLTQRSATFATTQKLFLFITETLKCRATCPLQLQECASTKLCMYDNQITALYNSFR